MRVLFVTNMWPDSARPWYGSFVQSQAESIQALGVDVEVLAIRGYATAWEYPRSALRSLMNNRQKSFDVTHAHYGHSGFIGRLNVRQPLVVSYCGDDLLGTPDPRRPGRRTAVSLALARAFAQLARIAAATITKSEQMALTLPAAVRPRNHVIPNGVDLSRFTPLAQDHARRRLGWAPEEKVALFVGNPAVPSKNFALAEAASALAAQEWDAVRLRTAWGIAPEEVPVWMSASDALIFPSLSEGSPNAVKEAMACELPIVSTPVGDVPERLAGVPGSAVIPPEPTAFAKALLEALHHGRSTTARAAVAQISVERVAKRVVGVYEAVLNGR